eukprot:760649-Hanusia_phi.AAC.1
MANDMQTQPGRVQRRSMKAQKSIPEPVHLHTRDLLLSCNIPSLDLEKKTSVGNLNMINSLVMTWICAQPCDGIAEGGCREVDRDFLLG